MAEENFGRYGKVNVIYQYVTTLETVLYIVYIYICLYVALVTI